MNHKVMPYMLPVASVLVLAVLFLFAKPALTGLFVAGQKSVLNAEIKIIADEILPEDAIVNAYLEKGNNSREILKMSIKEFMNSYPEAMKSFSYKQGKNSQLNYEGFGYIGSYILNISYLSTENLEKGAYTLKTGINWQDSIVSETSQEVRI